MSSIAYITDQKLIEYVRSSGKRELNFWRLSMRNFEFFAEGSLLFFIDGRSSTRNVKEKGIIGFGRAVGFKKMSPKKMWENYGTANGYHDYMSFLEAIQNAGKTDTLPRYIQSIELDSIVFFKGPIYLSEIGVDLPSKLESFTYLDKNNDGNTVSLIKEGMKLGIDTWFHAFNPDLTEDSVQSIIEEQQLREILFKIDYPFSNQQKNLMKLKKSQFKVHALGYDIDEGRYEIHLPCTSARLQQHAILGIISSIKNDTSIKDLSFKVILRKGINPPTIKLTPEIVLEYI